MTTTDTEGPHPFSTRTRLIIASIGLLLLLAALDQTIVSTALPTIVADLGGLEQLSWVVTAYILASTVAAPLYGKLGDLYGRRNMVFTSVGLFLLGSVLCGMSQTMGALIASRAVQGLGGGGLFVLALSVVGEVVPPRERGRIQGVFAAAFSVASVVGPLIGGWFTEAFSWHWIFYFNIPVGALAVAIFAASFQPTGKRAKRSVDWAGAAALSVALAAITLVSALGGTTYPWGSAEMLGLIALSFAATGAFIAIELRAEEPIIPMGLFRDNTFTVTSLLGFITGAAMLGAVTFLPVWLQLAKGVSPMTSGLLLIPLTVGILTTAMLAGRRMGQTGRYKWLPVIGLTLVTLGLLTLTTLSAETSLVLFSLMIALVGLGLGCVFPVVTTAVQNAVPFEQLGTATAAGVMFRQIGGSVAVAVFGTLFASGLTRLLAGVPGAEAFAGPGGLELGPQTLSRLPEAAREPLAQAVSQATQPIFWIAAAVAALGILVALRLDDLPLKGRGPAAD